MFPGQGSQFVGMGRDLFEQFPSVRTCFEEAEDTTKINVRKLCFEGPEEDLKLTANTQPCIVTMSVAIWRVLKNETGLRPNFFAGHSLGEYSALVAAEKLPFSRAVWLVRKRGEAMQDAVPPGVGAMAAVLNMPADVLAEHCTAASTKDHMVEVVNFNSPQQLVVAGHRIAVEKLCGKLEELGTKSVLLPVSAPFHSRLMEKARIAMEPALRESTLKHTEYAMIANLTGKVAAPYGVDNLIKQIDKPVLWMQSIETSVNNGCEKFVEIGPGKVLFGLARRLVPKTSKIMHTEDVRKAIADINQ